MYCLSSCVSLYTYNSPHILCYSECKKKCMPICGNFHTVLQVGQIPLQFRDQKQLMMPEKYTTESSLEMAKVLIVLVLFNAG